jgi:uncharacterized membrane protein
MDSCSNQQRLFATTTLKYIALAAYGMLLIFMPLWLIVWMPGALSTTLVLLIFVAPLCLPFKGLLSGNPYTYAWANFIIMWYFLHSLTSFVVLPVERIYATIEFILASIFFLSASYYAKYRGQELGLSIRKKKQ